MIKKLAHMVVVRLWVMKLRFKQFPGMWLIPIGLTILFFMDWKVGLFMLAIFIFFGVIDFILKTRKEF
jgi:hypothetical protein